MQKRLSATHTDFLNAVQSSRQSRVSTEMRSNHMSKVGSFSATDAMSHELVDKIQEPREFYRSIVPTQ